MTLLYVTRVVLLVCMPFSVCLAIAWGMTQHRDDSDDTWED